MKKTLPVSLVIYIIAFEFCFCLVAAGTVTPWLSATAQAQEYSSNDMFSPDQLDNLLAPIALYPDPLLAQVLIAATFVDQVDEASRWMRANNNPAAIDYQAWDVSVKAVAHYPPILQMMSDQLDWTTSVGQAYVYQSPDVMMSIQRLRAEAYKLGNLVTNERQEVIVEGNEIRIVPVQPEVIYVPSYDPNIIYAHPFSFFGDIYPDDLISFGVGFAIGVWLINDCDWHNHRIYYHGWRGSGWIAHSRPHVRVTDVVYVNNKYRNIQINRDIVHRNVNYNNLNRYSTVHHDVTYNNFARHRQQNPSGQPNAGNRVIRRNLDVNDPRIDVFRGHRQEQQPVERENQHLQRLAPQRLEPMPREENRAPESRVRPQPAPIPQREPSQRVQPAPRQPMGAVQQQHPFSVFGGSRSGLDPQAIIQRGQSSRALANQPASRPAPSAPNRPANPSGGHAPERRTR
jgi:hypothetical protein